jgi:hypothetical protein
LSEIHQQAIQHVYLQVLQKLQCHYSHRQRIALETLIRRIALVAGGYSRLDQLKLMVVHNGGLDSTHAVAFLRAAQLSLPLRCGQTFKLRIVTCQHDTLSEPLLGNLQRLYAALFCDEDPRVELLVADERQVLHFPAPQRLVEPLAACRRLDLLRAGQLSGGDVRTTFCHVDRQRLARAIQRAAAWGEPANALAQIDPPAEHEQYAAWYRQFVRRARLAQRQAADALDQPPAGEALPGTLCASLVVLHGCLPAIAGPHPAVRVLLLDELMGELLAIPNPPLMEFLGFSLAEFAGAVREADVAHPLLMAHLAGLRAKGLTLLDYRDGIEHYLALTTPLLRARQVPPAMLRDVLGAYASQRRLAEQRRRANALVRGRYSLDEGQLHCMLFSPFVDEAAAMPRYLRHCHPRLPLALPYIHSALRGESVPPSVERWLIDTSGLPMDSLRTLYGLTRVHVDDDHSLLARTRLWPPSARGIHGVHPVTGLPAAPSCVSPDD